ncbi:MAG: hypothetical protein FD149_841 [Rhodospirillaceae bacterium]|nr:MAG: hypothetical protein FD149_841 [Rhodospirillaceae bacterium]
MAAMGKNIIGDATPNFSARTVRVQWAEDNVGTAFLGAVLGSVVGRGVFVPWADRYLLERGTLGRSLEWSENSDVCADALWFKAHPEENPFSNKAGLSQAGTA